MIGATDDELSGLFHPGGLIDHLPKHAMLLGLGADPDAAQRWLAEPSIQAIGSTSLLLGRYATDAILRSQCPGLSLPERRHRQRDPLGVTVSPGTPISHRAQGTASTCRSSSTASPPRVSNTLPGQALHKRSRLPCIRPS